MIIEVERESDDDDDDKEFKILREEVEKILSEIKKSGIAMSVDDIPIHLIKSVEEKGKCCDSATKFDTQETIMIW